MNPGAVRWALLLLAVLVGFGLAPAAGSTGDAASLLRMVRGGQLDLDGAVEVTDVEIRVGIARLRLDRGLLVPAAPVGDRTVEFVWLGDARFDVMPPDDIEAGQLELFTGRRRMEASVEAAVLVLADPARMDALLSNATAVTADPSAVERATTLYSEWLDGTERTATGAESGIFRALIGDPAYERFFAVWCRSVDSGEWIYTFDPEDAEQLTIASFHPLQIAGWDRIRLARHIRHQQRKGRFLGVRVEDLGAWDIWLSTPWSPNGSDRGGSVGFETRHYDLNVRVLRRSLRLEGEATLHLDAIESGRRTVSLDLFRDLEIRDVYDSGGRRLFTFRSGPQVVVVLPEPSVAGQRLQLRVVYAGRALRWRGRGTWDLDSTDHWYPHCGSIDRATYDVTLHWPRKLDMLVGGRLIASGEDGRYHWQRRVVDIPSIAFSFAVGRYDIRQLEIGDVRLRLAFSRATGYPTAVTRDRIVDVVSRSLDFLERTFGDYPLDELTVVILPRRFSQSFLGFVALSDSVARAAEAEPFEAGRRMRETLVAHELAHQWWGNLVGWRSYRDQWLSEAMANYAGLLFHAESTGGGDELLAELSAGWRASLERTVESGHTVESLGPIVLGSRLNSSRAANGYGAIVYRKGAVVLSMLARAVGEERFLELLGEMVRSSQGSVLTTEEFIDSVARMTDLDLAGFARQYVYGTGIPRVYYEYEVDRESGDLHGWRLSGEARRLMETRQSWAVERRPDGTWDVVRHSLEIGGDHGTAVMVPFRIDAREGSTDRDEPVPRTPRAAEGGHLMLRGRREAFAIETTVEPDRLILDPRGEILAHFYSYEGSPKRVARFRAQDLLVEGRTEEAETTLLEALEAPFGPARPWAPWAPDTAHQERNENATIQLTLARLYLDTGREDEAQARLEAVDQLLAGDEWARRLERDVLWSRLDLRRGEPERAYKRLKPTLDLVAADRRRVQDRAAQLRLRSNRAALVEGYALLAVTAHLTGHETVYARALDTAREQGVEVDALVGTVEGRTP